MEPANIAKCEEKKPSKRTKLIKALTKNLYINTRSKHPNDNQNYFPSSLCFSNMPCDGQLGNLPEMRKVSGLLR